MENKHVINKHICESIDELQNIGAAFVDGLRKSAATTKTKYATVGKQWCETSKQINQQVGADSKTTITSIKKLSKVITAEHKKTLKFLDELLNTTKLKVKNNQKLHTEEFDKILIKTKVDANKKYNETVKLASIERSETIKKAIDIHSTTTMAINKPHDDLIQTLEKEHFNSKKIEINDYKFMRKEFTRNWCTDCKCENCTAMSVFN